MVTPYALFRRWIQKADRSREHIDGLSCFELKKRSIFLHQSTDFGQKSYVMCDLEIFHLIKLPPRCQPETNVFHVRSKDRIKTLQHQSREI